MIMEQAALIPAILQDLRELGQASCRKALQDRLHTLSVGHQICKHTTREGVSASTLALSFKVNLEQEV